jgi:hypothetical protein
MAADSDPKGFYRRLGVEPSASADEIRTAYRQLAKKLHPDVNKDANAKILFQTISEAYNVLSNPDLRASYDALRYSQPAAHSRETDIEPICCSHCGKVTAQPRSAVFYRVISLLLITMRTPIQGIFCSYCAKKVALRASLISAILGWWGFPWGPIWTIGSILGNAKGGRFTREVDENLLWYNTIAFFSKGKLAISYALAQQARRASNEKIALDALKLMDHLLASGVPASSPALKNPWSPQPAVVFAHILMLIALPTTIAFLIYADETRSANRNIVQPVRQAQSNVYQAPPQYPILKVAPSSPELPIPTCSSPPINGQILIRATPPSKEGHAVEIRNGSDGNAIIKMRNRDTGKLAIAFFVEKGKTASITNLPDGDYRTQYAFGDAFRSDCRSFVRITSASQFPDIESLRTRYTQTQIVRSRLSYTLFSLPAGNVRPESLAVTAFNAE